MKDDFPVWLDGIYSIIVALILTGLLIVFGKTFTFDQSDFSIIITILGIILGVLFTVLTILYAFEDNFKKNPAFIELKENNKYDLIYSIFMGSIGVIFFSLILILLSYFMTGLFDSNVINNWCFLLVSFLMSFSLIRTYRCFFVFSLLQKVLNKHKATK